MDNKQEKAQELDLDKMENISGGSTFDEIANASSREHVCPWCQHTFPSSQTQEFVDHVRHCTLWK